MEWRTVQIVVSKWTAGAGKHEFQVWIALVQKRRFLPIFGVL